MTAAFAAGVVVGWLSLAAAGVFLIGAVIRMADAHEAAERQMEAEAEAEQDEAGDFYMPREWIA